MSVTPSFVTFYQKTVKIRPAGTNAHAKKVTCVKTEFALTTTNALLGTTTVMRRPPVLTTGAPTHASAPLERSVMV